jgi:hypothetical protein
MYELDSFDSGYGTVAVFCEHGNEPLCSKKVWELLD